MLGISESFVKGTSKFSVLAGVVVRADLIVDGFTVTQVKVGGMDATQQTLAMYANLNRDDINVLLLNGCVISWYNVVDLHQIVKTTGLPLICVTYESSEGLDQYFKENFPESWQERVEVHRRNGPRTPFTLHTGHTLLARYLNISHDDTFQLLNKFTLQGGIPEPLRIARLLARSLMRNRLLKQTRKEKKAQEQ